MLLFQIIFRKDIRNIGDTDLTKEKPKVLF